jgi:RNase H-fold protein (predicted Holliday junction resolvase)
MSMHMKFDITVLALDPASKAVGWAIGDRIGAWKPNDWRMHRAEESVRHSVMCGRAMLWLADRITEHEPSVIVMEAGGGASRGNSDRCCERLRGALLGTAYVREVAVELVHPRTWQAWAKRQIPVRLEAWKLAGKPDDKSAQMILAWYETVCLPKLEAA